MKNHEIRFSIERESKEKSNQLKDIYAGGLTLQEFNKAVYLYGLDKFQYQISQGKQPCFITNHNGTKIKEE